MALDAAALAVPETHAADVGQAVLEAGGNAVDATVAVHFALAVSYPYAGNIGGGGFLLVHEPGGAIHALDYRETAPAAAHPKLFQDEAGEVVPGLSLRSHLAAGVPGSVAGMWELHKRYGSRPWAELLAPAITLAEEGFVLDAWTAEGFAKAAANFAELPERFRNVVNFAEYFRGAEGETFRQPELAATLRRIASEGPAGFYQGETAQQIVAAMNAGEGLITLEDLAGYAPLWREPARGKYRGYEVVSMSPPSSGGLAILEILGLLEHFEMPAWHGPEHLHLVSEVLGRTFADRAEHMGDPAFHAVPATELLDPERLAAVAATIRPGVRTDPATIRAMELPALVESQDTTHFTIVDKSGLAITNTTTINAAYGSGIVVPGAGFLLNNEMDDFAAKPGVPNLFGVTGGEANQVDAGKRMLSSMSPTFVLDSDGKLWLGLGSPGGSTIITSVFQVISNRIDYDLPIAEAVAAPRFHHQWPPRQKGVDTITLEEQEIWDPGTLARLEALGYSFRSVKRLGDIQAIEIVDGVPTPVSDPRVIGKALVVR